MRTIALGIALLLAACGGKTAKTAAPETAAPETTAPTAPSEPCCCMGTDMPSTVMPTTECEQSATGSCAPVVELCEQRECDEYCAEGCGEVEDTEGCLEDCGCPSESEE